MPDHASHRRVTSNLPSLATVKRWFLLTIVTIVAALFVGVSAFILLRWAPDVLSSRHDVSVQRSKEIASVRTALLALLGGLIAVAGAIYTAKTFRLSRQGQITDRLTRAVDQLGADAVDIRLGGIFALERLARESPADLCQIIGILTGFIRERSSWVEISSSEEGVTGGLTSIKLHPEADVQAAIAVIGRRDFGRRSDSRPCIVDLSRVDLRGADMTQGDFSGAIFNAAHLECANLSGANLKDVEAANAHFEKADLTGADLSGAILAESHLGGAALRFAQMNRTSLREADLSRANLFNATLDRADLWKAKLTKASLWNARLAKADLTDVIFEGTRHNGSTVWPSEFVPPSPADRR